jgi:serine/threonine-protein kinase
MSDPVSLIGEELAHFKVIAKLGEGGMGAVYRAEDTKLGREVALKVLPEELADEPERLARLRREAQVLAALNHPNIAAIYGLEEHDRRLVLVLELVEGEELAQLIERGPLAVDETIDIATQIALGLEEAHERGVIHRDLKPANVKITPEGVVKILDFGLAKPDAGESNAVGSSQMATVTGVDMTREGVIMGTAAYMSPEQARGRAIDRRADVWAFGCVVYEMLTGRRAFGGETMTDVLVSVVTGEPDWSLIPSSTPPGVRRLLRRCLRRDPRNRLRSLGDAVIELGEASDPEVSDGIAVRDGARLSRNLALWSIAGPLLGLVLGVALWWSLGGDSSPVQRPVRQLATVSEPVAIYDAFAPSLASSPTGDLLVYSGGSPRRLYGRLRDRFEAVPIPGTEGALAPFVSPDGGVVGFWADGALRKVPVGGGSPVTLCETNPYLFGAAWAPDGFIYFSRPWVLEDGSASIALVRVPSDGGAVEMVATAETENGRLPALMWPQLLPDGRNLAVTRWTGGSRVPAIEIVSTVDGSRKAVAEGYQQAAFSTTGHLLAGTPAGQIVALPFDLGSLAVDGEPVAIAKGVHRSRYGAEQFSVSSDGAVYWVPEVDSSRPDQLVWVDMEGNAEPASTHLRHYESPRLSADGFVVVAIRSARDDVNVWLLDTVRDTLRPVTIGAGASQRPLWVRAGVVYSVPFGSDEFPAGIYRRTLDGQEAPTLLVPGLLTVPSSISDDGRSLLFQKIGADTGWDLWRVDPGSGGAPEVVVASRFDQLEARYAPDESWIAFEADASGRSEIYVRRIGEDGIEGQISPHGGVWPVWSPRGDALFYLSDRSMMSVDVDLVGEPSAKPARVLFDVAGFARTFDVSADGRRFLMIRLGEEPSGRQINLTLDWQVAGR